VTSDRIFAAGLVVLVSSAIIGFSASATGATFTGTSLNPNQSWNTQTVTPPAAFTSATPAVAGRIDLVWTATTSVVGSHTLTYLVLRGAVGGPYSQIGTANGLTYSDTPSSDGSYEYVVQTKLAQGAGFFTSGNSATRAALSDRTAPVGTANAPAGSDVAQIAVPVSYSDGGTGVTSVALWAKAPGAVSFSIVTTNSFTASASGTSTFVYTAAAGVGTYSFYAVATDAAGNVQATPGGAQSTTLFDPTLELKRTTTNDGTDLDLNPAYTPSGADTTCALGSGQTCTFATTTYTTGQSFAAGTSTASLYLQNGTATIAFRASALGSGSRVTSVTINKPAGTLSGDVLIAALTMDAAGVETITPPAGWTLVRTVNGGSGLAIYWKAAGGSEPASYVFGFNPGNTDITGAIGAYSGVDNATPVDVENGNTSPGATSHTTLSVSTATANTRLVALFGDDASSSWTAPAGMTARVNSNGGALNSSLSISDAAQAATGATGTRTATSSNVSNGVHELLALRPAQLTCSVTVQVLQNATSLGSSTVAVTGPTSSLKTVSVTTTAPTFATGDRLYLKVSAPVSTSCVGALRYDGASSISKVVHP
jgi:hypothetical protein